MDFSLNDEQERYRQGVQEICTKFPDSYWRRIDAEKRYPEEFVRALTTGGWLSVLIPAEYGGAGVRGGGGRLLPGGVNAPGGEGGARPRPKYTPGAPLRPRGGGPQKPSPPATLARPPPPPPT